MSDDEAKQECYCPKCSLISFEDGICGTGGNFCRFCGVKLIAPPKRYRCDACRHYVKVIDKFCGNCGAELDLNIRG